METFFKNSFLSKMNIKLIILIYNVRKIVLRKCRRIENNFQHSLKRLLDDLKITFAQGVHQNLVKRF